MKRRLLLAAAAAGALASVAGCVSTPPSAAPVVVAVIGVPDPAKLAVIIQNHPNATGGQVQGLFFAAEMHTRERQLAGSLRPRAFAPAAALSDAIAEALRRPDRIVVRAPNPQRDREDFLKDYSVLGAQAAAYVDVLPREIGYWAESPTGAYRPWIIVAYRVHDSREGKVVASGLIGTGPAPPGETSSPVAQDDAFSFPSFEALTADPARAEAGMREAIRLVARALAQKL